MNKNLFGYDYLKRFFSRLKELEHLKSLELQVNYLAIDKIYSTSQIRNPVSAKPIKTPLFGKIAEPVSA